VSKTFRLSKEEIEQRRVNRAGKMSALKSKQQHSARKGDKALFKRMWNEDLIAA